MRPRLIAPTAALNDDFNMAPNSSDDVHAGAAPSGAIPAVPTLLRIEKSGRRHLLSHNFHYIGLSIEIMETEC
jgi:hypothetical protein